MDMHWFPRAVAHHPYIILLAVSLFSSLCLIIPLTIEKLPDFSDPQMGFEARGTIIAQRLIAWHNLIEATKTEGGLVENPLEYYQHVHRSSLKPNASTQNYGCLFEGIVRKKPKNKSKQKEKQHKVLQNDTSRVNNKERNRWERLLELRREHRVNVITDGENQNHDSDKFFCNPPISSYARVVIGANSEDQDLWSTEGILAQCHIDDAIRSNAHFSSLCETRSGHKCCRSWSPANYVALLSNRSSCLGVTENDLGRVRTLLQRCAYYYHDRQLLPDCAEDFNCQRHVPTECYDRNAVYHMLHYLLDVHFIQSHKVDNQSRQHSILQSAMIFLPIAASSATLDFYKDIENNDLTYGNFRVLGMQLGLKTTLFDRLLVSDSCFVLAGFVFVTLCIWVYTGLSVVLTITTILAVIFSLGISYATYTLVLRIHFFPFMNLLAIVVAVGIGADDAFIYCKIWESQKQQKPYNDGLVCLVQKTMKQAFPSMFVTSLTTAVAFFASIVSNVTAINCFSLFSGMTVIANFLLMITWLPACMVVSEHCKLGASLPVVTRRIIRPLRVFGDKVAIGFTAMLTEIVIAFRFFWLCGLGTMAIASCIIVFHYPGLQLPDYIDFQLFDKTHPFEQYDLIYSPRFWFERYEMVGSDTSTQVLPLRFVWGINPIDNGDKLDPNRKGTLDWDETFDIANPESQLWLEQFCRNLRNQSFYRSTMGPLLSNCFIESLRSWMQRRCKDPIDPSIDHVPCCENSKFPYKPEILRQCAAEATAELHRTPSYLWARNGVLSTGLKFEPFLQGHNNEINDTGPTLKFTPRIKALVVEYDSTYAYTLSFTNVHQFFHQVENWMQNQLKNAPRGMRHGFFVSTLEFYELQRTLYEGTIWAIGISLTLALTVLALVTLNPLVSLYAIVTIGAAIMVTVATLILLGWKLNVLESVAVSTAIGLTVDFSLHYAVSYKACVSEKKIERVKAALQQMGGPTFMAAITSGAAGALMLPSHVLAYIQIGIFLLLVMGISWIYATLFLCPMLAAIGPSSYFAQFKYPRLKMLSICFHKCGSDDMVAADKNNTRARRTCKDRGMLPESSLSTSSTVCQLHYGELESLARPPSPSSPPSPLSTLLH